MAEDLTSPYGYPHIVTPELLGSGTLAMPGLALKIGSGPRVILPLATDPPITQPFPPDPVSEPCSRASGLVVLCCSAAEHFILTSALPASLPRQVWVGLHAGRMLSPRSLRDSSLPRSWQGSPLSLWGLPWLRAVGHLTLKEGAAEALPTTTMSLSCWGQHPGGLQIVEYSSEQRLDPSADMC